MRLQTDSIIFDLDGTLWDASATCTEAWNESLRELGMLSFSISQEAIQSFSGLRVEHVLSQHFSFIPHADHARSERAVLQIKHRLIRVRHKNANARSERLDLEMVKSIRAETHLHVCDGVPRIARVTEFQPRVLRIDAHVIAAVGISANVRFARTKNQPGISHRSHQNIAFVSEIGERRFHGERPCAVR